MALQFSHAIGILLALLLMAGVSIWSGRKVRDENDFATAEGSAGTVLVVGALLGTIIGGASTVGTAQLAGEYGMSSLWFTLGTSSACVALAFIFSSRMRQSGCKTIEKILEKDYGAKASLWASVLGSLGMFLNIIVQLLASVALLSSVFHIPPVILAVVSALFMGVYVIFGGMKSMTVVGLFKGALIYLVVIAGGFTALKLSGGLGTLMEVLPKERYFNPLARGAFTDLGAGLAVMLGILSTQTYFQSILTGRNDRITKRGTLITAILLPPIGIGSMFIGMYMKLKFPLIPLNQAFPQFILIHLPGFIAGLAFAVLLITVITAGSGLVLGISTVFVNNIYSRLRPDIGNHEQVTVTRIAMVTVLTAAVLFTFGDLQAVILQWSFMSMGLRASVAFLPMCCALFLFGKIDKRAVLFSIISGPIAVLLSKMVFKVSWDPLFAGLAVNLIVLTAGYFIKKKTLSGV